MKDSNGCVITSTTMMMTIERVPIMRLSLKQIDAAIAELQTAMDTLPDDTVPTPIVSFI